MLIKKYLTLLIGCLASMAGFAHSNQPIVCNTTYALCNAAPCQQIPGESNTSLCYCSIWKGKNIGYSSCQQRQLASTQYGNKKLLSTFSFGGFHYQYMQCSGKNPWATCLDQPCLVNKENPRRAYCRCKIIRNTAFVTFAGNCQTKNCGQQIWSAAKVDDNKLLTNLLAKHMNLKKIHDLSCRK